MYRAGYCAQQGEQIMVQDTNLKWNAFKANFRKAYLVFSNGTKCKVSICNECLESPNLKNIFDSVIGDGSQAGEVQIEMFNSLGTPVSIVEI